MEKLRKSSSTLFSILLLILIALTAASPVTFLPGFQGSLPFQLQTGYIGVGDSDDVQLFYYFFTSESKPETDPLLLWLTGGPGCSSLSAILYEIGPITFEKAREYCDVKTVVDYNESFPSLVLNPHAWTKAASIIFLEIPVGTGFSYATKSAARHSNDLQESDHAYQFLHKWFKEHPEFLRNPFYVGGDSYAGIGVPIITHLIANGNEMGFEPFINLKGYILGNAATFEGEYNYRIPFAHGVGLISDELFESLKRNCKGEYFNVHPNNTECLKDVQAYDQMIDGINEANILEPSCDHEFTSKKWIGKGRSLHLAQLIRCRNDQEKFSYAWANDEKVREALHVPRDNIGEWKRCGTETLPFRKIIKTIIQCHANLSAKGYRSLIYSGDHDMTIPYQSTQAWIKSLNYSTVDNWRPWIVEGQVAGYTRTYSNKMTFATLKGAGHVALAYMPIEGLAMFKRWISFQPL